MSLRTTRSVIVACTLILLSAAESTPQTRLKGRVQTPGNDPVVSREQVAIDGAGKYDTDDDGEFEFDLVQGLKVGQPARFRVKHVNPLIQIQQWIVIRPCDLLNGRKDSLPAVGSEPVTIVVLPKGDVRLKSLNRDYSILGCTIEEAASELKPAVRSDGPNRSSLFDGGSSIVADQFPYQPVYESAITRGFPRFAEASYRVPAQEKSETSSLSSALFDQASLTKKAAELGFTPRELADALNAWVRSAEDSYQKGLAALYGRRYAEATKYISASIPSPPGDFVKRYVPLARAEYEQGHYSAAEEALRRVLAVHGDDPLVLNNLGVVLIDEGKYSEAEPLLKRALAIGEKALGPDHPDLAIYLENLGALYKEQGKYSEAEPLLKRALAIDEKTSEPDHRSMATDLSNLAELYTKQGKYAEAEPLYKAALLILKALGSDPEVATAMNNLALVYKSEGKYAEAESEYRQALRIHESTLGPDHPTVAKDLNNMAALYYVQGKYAEAEPLYQRALAIDEKALGADNPKVAEIAENLAADLRKLGRDAEAKVYEDQAAQIRAKKQK